MPPFLDRVLLPVAEVLYHRDVVEGARHFNEACQIASSGRRLSRTDKGLVGLVPHESRIGDEIVVFLGVRVPFVVRKKGHHRQPVGACYVRNMMDGQALELDG